MKRYNPKTIESKWQKVWDQTKLYQAKEDDSRPKIYATPMLPYPSGAGLHVGHVRNYSAADTIARWYRQRGFNVLSAIGWDSFGLPAENYAITTGTPPWESTQTNIRRFREQLKRLGISYDWSREIDTSDPAYYKWTQWIFTKLFEHDLAYQAESLQWWCPKCKTVLANEQVVDGKCWRHEDTDVIKKRTKQWFFKITDYADDLLDAIEDLDWPASVKAMQTNWIGRSVGVELVFKLKNDKPKMKTDAIRVFTTRPDTIYGATFLVLAPEHPLVAKITSRDKQSEVEEYVRQAGLKGDVERMDEDRAKTGIFTGGQAVNPATGQAVPVWIADYVLMGYGTGAIMAVPANDQRDWEFARQFKLPVVEIIKGQDKPKNRQFGIEGELINSGEFSGGQSAEAREAMVKYLADQGLAKNQVNYRLRDWLISRQRYWGAPIPIIHCSKCGAVAVPETDLPVELPKVKDFAPTGKGTSVLADVEAWVNVKCPNCRGPAKRETDTMDGYACSSWYLHRYTDPRNARSAWDSKKLNYWFGVDVYFGGDHAVSHLLYTRFWNRFFVELGLVDQAHIEPIKKLVFNGYINAEDGSKMSKSRGNVVDPLEVIDSGYGADALRLFELFIGPYDQDAAWNPSGVPGTYRFLQRVWTLFDDYLSAEASAVSASSGLDEQETQLAQAVHRTIKKVTADLERMSFNTAIAAMMELVNTANKLKAELPFDRAPAAWRQALESLAQLLAPFAPHMAEELWLALGHDDSVHVSAWPAWDEDIIARELVTIVVQVDGKVRATLLVPPDTATEELVEMARQNNRVAQYLGTRRPRKTVTVPGRLINFVTR